jgi:hypothetical protein
MATFALANGWTVANVIILIVVVLILLCVLRPFVR